MKLYSCIPFVLNFVLRTINFSKLIQTQALVREDGCERTIFVSSVEYNDNFFEPYNTKNVVLYREVFALDEFRKRLANVLSAQNTVDVTVLLDIDEERNTILLARLSISKKEKEEHECLPFGTPEEHIFIGTRQICGFCGSTSRKN
jgi:hypothetical protein